MSVAEVQPADDLVVEGGDPSPAPAPEPEVIPEPSEQDPEPEPAPEPEPVAEARPKGGKKSLVQELIEERTARKTLEAQLREHTQAITDGRVIVRPPAPAADHERERFEAVAKQLNFVKADGTPDLESAAKVDSYVKSTVRQAIAPMEQTTLEGRANANMSSIWAQAKKDGIPDEAMSVVEQEFRAVMGQHNAAAMLADPNVAETIFQKGLGAAYRAGKLTGKPKPVSPNPDVAPATGRRPSATNVQLSPALQRVYKDAGLDPNKTASATKPLQEDERGAISLED